MWKIKGIMNNMFMSLGFQKYKIKKKYDWKIKGIIFYNIIISSRWVRDHLFPQSTSLVWKDFFSISNLIAKVKQTNIERFKTYARNLKKTL